ncbi:hypothetical protein N7456_012875 [Penicillium angulare]|uniref:Leucine-rich repeat, typical subtype n=1 Tax=Penicillium angulare TaxID=116970 RepID=A0A9W9EKC5_9EURO|nr:hypothetical protein N7456_012875 [Penicillium angulare]
MSNQPWLDSLSDDWESVPATPTTPGPAPKSASKSILSSSRRGSLQNSPSRIPVPARRSVEQSSPAGDKRHQCSKVTRPCHFVKREPPTPKTPRTPKTPSKLRSPVPSASRAKSPQSPKPKPKPTPKSNKSTKTGAKPTPGPAGKQPSAMETRSPLRAVSNVSTQSDYEASDTVQIKPKKDHNERGATPEWRKRLVRGEISAGDQRDLFAPIGLESVFKPPTPSSGSGQHESIPFTRQDEHLWDFTDAGSKQESTREDDPEYEGFSERVEGDHSGTGMESPFGTVNHRAPWADKQRNFTDRSGLSQGEDTGIRTASGLEDLRNEGITPITFTRNNTLEGHATSEVIKSALKQVTNKLETLSMDTSRPDSPASDSLLFYNHSEPRPDGSPHEDSLLDVTSHSLPQDLSMGTLDFSRRKTHRPFHPQFSPSPFPSHRLSPATLANAKTRSSPLFNRSQNNGSPILPRPSSSHVRPSTSGDAESKQGTMPSSGSPLKLFGEHDTFTNNRLLRRMSQFEETFGDQSGSDEEEPPSPSEEARRKGENRSLLSARHEPLSEISPRRHDRGPSRNIIQPRLTRFGDGELDKFDFSDTSPYEHKIKYDEPKPLSRPTSRRLSSNRQQYLRRSSQQDSLRYARSASSGFTRKPSAWTRQSYFDHLKDTKGSARLNQKENFAFSETKRVPKAAAADPLPKRRRTILRNDGAEAERPYKHGDHAPNFGDSMSLLQRSLLQHGVQLENGEYLAPPGLSQSMQRPRTPTPSQIRSRHESKILSSRQYSESNIENLDYSDSFSIEGDLHIPLVKITGTSDSSRKGSITTQDYLNEATKIMEVIRAKSRTVPMTSLQESDGDSEAEDDSYDDESTREAFSRPPSRDGTNTDLRRMREPKELNPQILNYLKQYQEREDGDLASTGSIRSLNKTDKDLGSEAGPRRLVSGTRKRKPSIAGDDIAETIAQDLMTINTQMSGFSVHSVPTGSSQNSQAKGMLSSDMVSHLIPEQVNGFTYDRFKNLWIRNDGTKAAPRVTREDDNDPFQDIPDLSVDELQEMMRVNGLASPSKRLTVDGTENHAADPLRVASGSPKKPESRPHTRDGEPSVTTGSTRSRATRLGSSVPNSGTRATSWSTEEPQLKNDAGESSCTQDADSRKVPQMQPSPGASISFSSPVAPDSLYTNGNHARVPDENLRQSSYSEQTKSEDQSHSTHTSARRDASVAGQPFIRRPISRIEERNEEAAEDLGIVRTDEHMAMQQTPGIGAGERSLVPIQSGEHDNSYSFHMSPLAEFSVNQPDHQLNLEMSYVANRTHPTSLRQVHGTFALATEDLIKHITDVEPYEPYWEHVRRLVLREKGLITLHKLSDFCPRLEDLDVSDNDIGQLSGVPTTLRTLKIPRNCLSNLTPWSHLTNLQYLDISGNDIESLDGFSGLIHLRELKANDNQIRNIDGILDLNGLLSLKLSNNSLAMVDFEGSELTRLRDLDLSHNCLTSVRNIDWLPSLATLDVSANQISQLEVSASLISLRALRVSANRLQELDMSNFSALSLLYADNNGLSTITGLENCHNLEVLSVREQTQLANNGSDCALDLDLGSVKDIRKVFLSSNKLTARCLSPSSPLLRLQLLDIAACTLPSLPVTFASHFPNLKVLNINFNSLSELEPLVGMNCLARLMMVGNRLARMRRICQILSRLGRTGRGSPCSLRKLDIRGNPLTVGFYPPAITGNGSNMDTKKLKAQDKAIAHKQGTRQDLSDALADLDHIDHVAQAVTWDDGVKPEKDIDINDPFTLPGADQDADDKYLNHLDRATRLRRRVLELLLYAGTSGSLHTLDGLELRPTLGGESSDMGQAWTKLEELGVLRRKAIT